MSDRLAFACSVFAVIVGLQVLVLIALHWRRRR